MITAKKTGDPTLVRLDADMVVGPFMYTKKADAEAAAEDHSFFPNIKGLEVGVTEIAGTALFEGILSRFQPSDTHVASLNEEFLPLTDSACAWVDDILGRICWEARGYGGEGLLPEVVRQACLLMGVEAVKIGLKENPEDFITGKALRARAKIAEHVQIYHQPEPPAMYGVVNPGTLFRVFTVGMDILNSPDLELGGVNALFVGDAQALLAGWAAYSLDHPMVEGMNLTGCVDPLAVTLEVVGTTRGRLRLEIEQVVYTDSMTASHMVH